MTTMLERLLQIRAQPELVADSVLGICAELMHHSEYDSRKIHSLFEDWSEYSGEIYYPIRHPLKSAEGAFDSADEYEMWSKDHVYGAARWRLVDYLIDELSK